MEWIVCRLQLKWDKNGKRTLMVREVSDDALQRWRHVKQYPQPVLETLAVIITKGYSATQLQTSNFIPVILLFTPCLKYFSMHNRCLVSLQPFLKKGSPNGGTLFLRYLITLPTLEGSQNIKVSQTRKKKRKRNKCNRKQGYLFPSILFLFAYLFSRKCLNWSIFTERKKLNK